MLGASVLTVPQMLSRRGDSRVRTRILAAAFALSVACAAVSAAEPKPGDEPMIPAGASEPTKCFRLIAEMGLEIPVGIVIDLCAGSVSAEKTVACLIEAWGPTESGGLGLMLGLAVDLCRTLPANDGSRAKVPIKGPAHAAAHARYWSV